MSHGDFWNPKPSNAAEGQLVIPPKPEKRSILPVGWVDLGHGEYVDVTTVRRVSSRMVDALYGHYDRPTERLHTADEALWIRQGRGPKCYVVLMDGHALLSWVGHTVILKRIREAREALLRAGLG